MNTLSTANARKKARDIESRGQQAKYIRPADVRAELNIEKWPGIWQPSKSSNAPAVRVLQRQVSVPDGRTVSARVRIGFTDMGSLTTEDQKTFYALIRQWEQSGRSQEVTFFSTQALRKILNKKWGTNVKDAITESLLRLRTTPLTWLDSYQDATRPNTVLEVLEPFQLLEDLKIVRKRVDGHVTKQAGYFRFNRRILANLLANHTKPVLLEVILGFRSEIAQLLYTHLDLMLADKPRYERRTNELFDDLGLQGTEYKYRSVRKRKLAPALAELRGVELTTGSIASAELAKTKDGKDYKVVIQKGKANRGAAPQAVISFSSAQPAKDQPPVKDPIQEQAEEIVGLFYNLFHGATKSYPQYKEIAQAESLIAKHGHEVARYVVEFSRGAAAETNYSPQTFGGILQYTSRAVGAYEEVKREQARRRQEEEAARGRLAYRDYQEQQIEAYIAAHPAEYAALVEETKTALIAELEAYPNMLPKTREQTVANAADGRARAALLEQLGLLTVEEFAERLGNQQPQK